MTKLRRVVATVATALVLATGSIMAVATPAFAACGDTSGSWVPLLGSEWNLEVYVISTSDDLTAQAVFTYSGQIAVTVFDDTLQVFTGNWDFEGGTTFAWSATEVGDNTNRLTFEATANDCGGLGGVHAAYGTVIHQTNGLYANLFMGRVA